MSNDKPDLRAIEALVAKGAEQDKRIAKLERAGRLSNAAIDAGSLTMKDQDGNPVAVWDTTSGGLSVTYPTGPTPPTPSAPAVVGTPGALTVQWDGTYQDQATAPGDLAAVQVYAAPATGLESDDPDDPVDPDLVDDDWMPTLDTLVGTIHAADGGTVTAVVDPGDYDVHLVAVALSGASSDPTTATPVTVPSLAEDPELDAALTELDAQLAGAAEDLARVSGLYTTSTSAPTVADGAGKPDGAWWVQIDATGAQVGTWAWSETTGAWTATPLTPQQIPALDVGKLVASSAEVDTAVINKIWAGILTVRDLIADAINGKTITGATINGGYIIQKATDGSNFTIELTNDSRGGLISMNSPKTALSTGTSSRIRVLDDSAFDAALVLSSPATKDYPNRGLLYMTPGPSSADAMMKWTGSTFYIENSQPLMVMRGKAGSRSGLMTELGNLVLQGNAGATLGTNEGYVDLIGQVRLPLHPTTTAAANTRIADSNNIVYVSTSVRRNKLNIEDAPQDWADKILNLPARTWFDKGQAERLADYSTMMAKGVLDEDEQTKADILLEEIEAVKRIPGFVAEELEDAGLEGLCEYRFNDETNETELVGVQYERMTVPLLVLAKKQQARIESLESRLEALEERMSA